MSRARYFSLLVLATGTLLLANCGRTPDAGENQVRVETRPTSTAAIGVSLVTLEPPTPALLQLTPRLLASPSPQPTATPIRYTIESGDTLLAIALDWNTTTEDIMALNPGIRPELLQVGQQIVLPPPAALSLDEAPESLEPIDVVILGLTTYLSPTGGTWVLGEGLNRGPRPVENVRVEIKLSAGTGQASITTTAWLQSSVLMPGERSPFGALVAQSIGESPGAAASVVGGSSVDSLGDRYVGLEVQEPDVEVEDTRLFFKGMIANVGEETAERLRVVATFYSVGGHVAGFTEVELDGPLEPGQRLPFEGESLAPGSQIDEQAFVAQGIRQDNS